MNRIISQDIAALQTVNRFSPNFSCLGVDEGQVKKVDLKGYRSTVVKGNRVQEVDLPHSPIAIPSSLQLTDSTSTKAENPKWKDIFIEKTEKHEPKSLFSYHVKQNEVPVKKRPQTCLSEYNSTVVPNVSNKKMKLPIDDWGLSSQIVERKDTTDKDMFHSSAQVNNPWASEDFQITPLNEYDVKYEDMIPWKVNGDFNKKSLKEDINPKPWIQENFKSLKPSYKTSYDNNFPKLSPEICHTKKHHSSRFNPIKPPDLYLEEKFSRNSQKAYKNKSREELKNHMNQYSKLDSFDGDYSFHAFKKPKHHNNWDQIMFSNPHMNSVKYYESYSTSSYYEPDSESTPVNKLTHNKRTGSHSTLEEIKSNFIRNHGNMNSLLDNHHYKMPPRIGNIPVESPLFRFHPRNYHEKNQIANGDETPICENPPHLFNNHHNVRKSLTPLFDSTQQMAALTPNELSFVKMLSQDQKVMTSFDEESNIGLRDGGTPYFREKSKKRKSADKSKEMTEVLAELSQLQHENDKDNMQSVSPVSQTQTTMDSPNLSESVHRTMETEVHVEKKPLNKTISKSDTPTSNGDLLDTNHAPIFNDNLPEYNHAQCTSKENLSKNNSTSTSKEDLFDNNITCITNTDFLDKNNTCISKEDFSEHKQVPSTSAVDLSVSRQISDKTLCHSPILIPDSFETQAATKRLNRSFEDGNPESFNLQVDTKKAHVHKLDHIANNIDVLTPNDFCTSDQTLEPFSSVHNDGTNTAISLRQKENTVQLDVHVDMTRDLESEASSVDPTTSCHLLLQSGDVLHRLRVDQATQTDVLTKEVALSPIFKKYSSISVSTQWQSLEFYSPKFTQGCVELCEDETNGTQLHTHCNVKDIEKFSTEYLTSTQDSLMDNSDSSQTQSFYSLRSRQKCLQS
ncbi:hypothetical protein LOTGIDRAFT_234094 [Lottia gigantea]|uniref:Uncharacterized protein n=1 Tax=Lottia gigantea TaxID=225164 RepID=V4A024_LOTGI|nr:hypothetical protein LOTGIDRAFT_234094 [Lottia gigantea]ESO89992.1 hypothetical protein LOTGIDRAFT_234094 [Lottia gigantea]